MIRTSTWNSGEIFCLFLTLSTLLILMPQTSLAQSEADLLLASRIIDQNVSDPSGEVIGEVDDLVIRRNGRIKKVTMEIGGFLDIGDKLIAVSPNKLQMEDGKVIVSQTKEKLDNKMEFDYYRRGLRPGYYYRPRPYYRPYRSRYYPPYHWSYPAGEPSEWAYSPGRFLASVIIDRDVINNERIYLGKVEDLLFDKQTREVKKIILSVGEFVGKEETYVELPYRSPGFAHHGLVYDISEEEVRSLPKYPYED